MEDEIDKLIDELNIVEYKPDELKLENELNEEYKELLKVFDKQYIDVIDGEEFKRW